MCCHLVVCLTGYGFVDFDSPAAAQKAVTALKSSGVQAQMAKVRPHLHSPQPGCCLPFILVSSLDPPLPPVPLLVYLLTSSRVCSQSSSCRPIKLIPPALGIPHSCSLGGGTTPPVNGTNTKGWHCLPSGLRPLTPPLHAVRPSARPPARPPKHPRNATPGSPSTQPRKTVTDPRCRVT